MRHHPGEPPRPGTPRALAALFAALLPIGCAGSLADDDAPAQIEEETKAHGASAPASPAVADSPDQEPGRNHLDGQTSHYLLQHANNPIHWYAWGPEAFEAARAQGKPVFLSVGYRSCYWCHVMERECFEDEEIAAYLNEHFISIKVDREERPDVDQIYMTALQAINNGQGGWPMTMFLTPDGRPFYGGTYFPPEPRDGMPGFPQLLEAIHDAWADRRDDVESDAEQLTAYVRRVSEGALALGDVPLDRALAEAGLAAFAEQFDPLHGGFGPNFEEPSQPKFPQPVDLAYLLDQHRRGRSLPGGNPGPLEMVLTTLDRMSRGGIRDHLAGGYHRYSTDRAWAVPHFEKMLYDNALLVPVFLDAAALTDDPRWLVEARSTLDFVADVMAVPGGGFASSLDAETGGEEGRSYVWTREEVKTILGDDESFALFARCYGLDREPNFEDDRFVLLRPDPIGDQAVALGLSPEELEAKLAPLRARLLDARRDREQPFRDDTALTAWNGLMLAAFADGAAALDDPRYREIAEAAADFLLDSLRDADGHLLRTHRDGNSKGPAFLEDYAFVVHGLLRLHAATDDPRWLDEARSLADLMIASFADPRRGGFFFTADDHESLVARVKDPIDNALPAPNAVAIRDLLALHRLTGDASYLDVARSALESFAPTAARSPAGTPTLLVAVDEYLDARDDAPHAAAPEAAPAFSPGRLQLSDAPGATPSSPGRALVTAKATVPSAFVRPGEPFEVRVALTIADHYHLNANPAGAPNLIPTTLSLPTDSPARLLSVDYPDGHPLSLPGLDAPIPVFEGTVTPTARLQLPEDTPAGPLELTLRLRYQACDDRSCLAPATLNVAVPLVVSPPDSEP